MTVIQRSELNLWPFSAFIPVWRDRTSSSTSTDSIGTRRTASGNYCKTLSAIQRSNQKLWPFLAVFAVLHDSTSSSTSRDSIGNIRETVSGNYCKKYERNPTVELKVMALFGCYSGLARQDLLFNEYGFHRYYKNGLRKLL